MKKLVYKTQMTCPVCGGDIALRYAGLLDRFSNTASKKFDICECRSCQIVFTNPLPTGDLSILYPKYYFSQTAKEQDEFSLDRWYRHDQYAFDFSLLTHCTGLTLNKIDSYLDVGSGSGDRVMYARKHGVRNVKGLEPHGSYIGSVDHDLIETSSLANFKPRKKYQLVSLFHVLEHLNDPIASLAHIYEHLIKDDGYLVLQVPNYGSIERVFFGSKWFGFDVPRHIYHFDKKSLVRLLEQQGYSVVCVYQKNAWLHPVTLVPSLHRDLDVGRIWVHLSNKPTVYWKLMRCIWILFTVLAIPITLLMSLFGTASMLTVVAQKRA